MEELIKKHTETQELMDKTLMEIGLKYSHYTLTQDKSLVDKINEKVELFQLPPSISPPPTFSIGWSG